MPPTQNNNEMTSGYSGVVRLKLPGNWHAVVAVADSKGSILTTKQWSELLKNPLDLLKNPEKVLKPDGSTTVVVQKVGNSHIPLQVVVKSQRYGFSDIPGSFMSAKSLRNFITAAKLNSQGIPTARPLAAVWRRRGLCTTHSIYISEYLSDSTNLNLFTRQFFQGSPRDDLACKKDITRQAAAILASLHNAGLWHRDAKASNFLVCKQPNGKPKLMLVDMDGIKPYIFRKKGSRYRSLAKLASTLLWNGSIHKTDYLRAFKIYSNLTGLDDTEQPAMVRTLAQRAIALRLLTLARTAIRQAKKN